MIQIQHKCVRYVCLFRYNDNDDDDDDDADDCGVEL